MARPILQITENEKAALIALAVGVLDTWKTAFLVSEAGKETRRTKAKSLEAAVTRWKNSPRISKYFEYCTRLLADRDSDARARGREEAAKMMEEEKQGPESESVKPASRRPVDYNNPEARRQLYNRIITEASDDPRTQLDAAKIIEQLQRDDRQAAQENKIQRFYLPLCCHACPMYEKAAKKQK